MSYKSLFIGVVLNGFGLFASVVSAKDYAIEVIIFENKDGLQQSDEQFNYKRIIPVPTDGLDLENTNESSQWRTIPEEEYILNNVAQRLKQSGKYRILKHIAWRQPVFERKDSQAISIKAGRDFSGQFPERAYRQFEFNDQTQVNTGNTDNKVPELEGTLNVVITRYLHIYSDLVYRIPRTIPNEVSDALDRTQVLVDYSVNSHRRMRSRELHYIDHPVVGILVEATPIDDK